MFRQLSFDTSTSDIHLALFDAGQCVYAKVLNLQEKNAAAGGRQEATSALIPSIDEAIKNIGWKKSDLDCITVGTGPGSFTGIRTGVVTGRALAQALNLPLYPVSFLESLAAEIRTSSPEDFAIALKATNDFVFFHSFLGGEGKSAYVSKADLGEALKAVKLLYTDEPGSAAARSGTQPEMAAEAPLRGIRIEAVPIIENVAIVQAALVWQSLSKVGSICEKLVTGKGHRPATDESERALLRKNLEQSYPYQKVTPTYLRGPSVTVKTKHV